MSAVGQIEKKTKQRVVKLFREALGYGYLGNWEEREGNRNIESDLLRSWLAMIEAASGWPSQNRGCRGNKLSALQKRGSRRESAQIPES